MGVGFGWGLFLAGIGTPFKRMEKLLGRDEEVLRKARQRLDAEREAGTRPPFGAGARGEGGADPLLERLLRGILARRARTGERMRLRVRPTEP